MTGCEITAAQRDITVPFIPGDGIGPELMAVARRVIDEAVRKAGQGSVTIKWEELPAGEMAFRSSGEHLPSSTLDSIRARGVALKGPLTTPVGGGIRSLNVAIRQALDLYACVRPVRYFEGVPSPMKDPGKMNVVIFRENTEDVYKGIEWKRGSKEAKALIEYLSTNMGVKLTPDTGIGIKPISEGASKRLIRAAIEYAVKKKLKTVTLVHKGNIMKFTEGAFRDWGYELVEQELSDKAIRESELEDQDPGGKVIVNDRIADNMFQQILTRPGEYSVLATPNLNGDYLSDACAAQVGGLGMAPGANIGDSVATFEAVHGSAAKYAGKDVANPCALILSGAMMLEYLGLKDAGDLIVRGVEKTLAEGVLTQDLARVIGKKGIGTKSFGFEIISRLA